MLSVLIIEDEEGILKILQEILSKFGYHAEIAEDGLQGIHKFETKNFDLVITDMRMPGIDGRGVVQYIRNSRNKNIPLIGISGTPWLLCDVGFDAILPKPFSARELVECVEQQLKIPSNSESELAEQL